MRNAAPPSSVTEGLIMPLSEMKWVILFRGGTYSDRKMLTLLSRKESGQTREKKFRSKWTSLESLIQIARPGVDATRPDTHDRTKLTCWVPDTELLFSQGVAGIRRRHHYYPNDPIQARASSMSVRGRTTRTPSPERKCLTLCVTRSRAPEPIAAARIGTSFGSASSRARSRSRRVGR